MQLLINLRRGWKTSASQASAVEFLATEDHRLQQHGPERESSLDDAGDSRGDGLLCPEERAVGDQKHERAEDSEAAEFGQCWAWYAA